VGSDKDPFRHDDVPDIASKLAIIMTAQRVLHEALEKHEKTSDERLSRLHDRMEDLEDVYRGGIGAEGVEEQLRKLHAFEREMRAIILEDQPLKPALKSRVDNLEKGDNEKDRKLKREGIWADAIKVIVAAAVGAILSRGPEILKAINNPPHIQAPSESERRRFDERRKKSNPIFGSKADDSSRANRKYRSLDIALGDGRQNPIPLSVASVNESEDEDRVDAKEGGSGEGRTRVFDEQSHTVPAVDGGSKTLFGIDDVSPAYSEGSSQAKANSGF
jgi:hypothetical protein